MNQAPQEVKEVEVPEQEVDLEPQEELEQQQQSGLGTFGLGRLKNLSLDF